MNSESIDKDVAEDEEICMKRRNSKRGAEEIRTNSIVEEVKPLHRKRMKRKAVEETDSPTEISHGRNSKRAAVGKGNRKKSKSLDDEDEVDSISESGDEVEEDTSTSNRVPESGQIFRVHVEDFMNHPKFTVNFRRHVNFINGINGSGKSAVVAAIQLCLGGSAKNTGRGNCIGSFVREGCQSGQALIQIILHNDGLDPFYPELYGNKIYIEKKIFITGRTSFKLLSEKKEPVSIDTNARNDLRKMMIHFGIYVTNPCCVLTQEDSKIFIQGSEKDKYEFFVKATGLDVAKKKHCDGCRRSAEVA